MKDESEEMLDMEARDSEVAIEQDPLEEMEQESADADAEEAESSQQKETEQMYEAPTIEVSKSLNCAKVTLDACLGSFNIDFASVNRLQNGDLIQLAPHYDGAISLRNNGVEVGCAQMVLVNGQMALQVQRLWR